MVVKPRSEIEQAVVPLISQRPQDSRHCLHVIWRAMGHLQHFQLAGEEIENTVVLFWALSREGTERKQCGMPQSAVLISDAEPVRRDRQP